MGLPPRMRFSLFFMTAETCAAILNIQNDKFLICDGKARRARLKCLSECHSQARNRFSVLRAGSFSRPVRPRFLPWGNSPASCDSRVASRRVCLQLASHPECVFDQDRPLNKWRGSSAKHRVGNFFMEWKARSRVPLDKWASDPPLPFSALPHDLNVFPGGSVSPAWGISHPDAGRA